MYEVNELEKYAEIRPEPQGNHLAEPRDPAIYADEPFLPCFEKVLKQGIMEGERNNILFRFAVMLLGRGLNSKAWEKLYEINQKACQPPCDEAELGRIFSSASAENNGQPRYKTLGCEGTMQPYCDPECPVKKKQEAEKPKEAQKEAKREPIDFRQLEGTIKKWLRIEDPYLIKHITAVVIANKLAGDPVWVIYKAAPGGAKTELIQGLNGCPEIYSLSEITENSFLSGEKSRHDPSILLQVKEGTIFTYKDFGVVISMHRDRRAAILHQLREIYDGSFKKITGKAQDKAGGNVKSWKGKIGFIAGATTAIEEKHAVYASLGERFLQYHITPPDRLKVARLVVGHNRGKEKEMRSEIKNAFAAYLNNLNIPAEPIPLDDELIERIVALADFVTLARSGIERDSYHTREIEFIPDPELPTRFAKQLSMIAAALKLINGGQLVEKDVQLLNKTALDCIPTKRRSVILTLLETEDWLETDAIADKIGYATTPTRRILEDLAALKIVERDSSGRAHGWGLFSEIRQKLKDNRIFPEMSGGI